MASLTLKGISKRYKGDNHVTLKNVDLHVDNDEFLILLGPSGCGKTTLLKIISGLLTPTEGEILLDGEDVTKLAPQERGIGMVFQNYALYPHMNNRKNLTFALEVAKIKREERKRRVDKVSEFLEIEKYLSKKPSMLSGGERQRVAIGRAMVSKCKIYLFDEPLSNLDENLRTRLRPEILNLFHRIRVPFIYVTHDQVDAMTMGTKIAVMNEGEIQQLGSPTEIYNNPTNLFVASFISSPAINTISADVVYQNEKILLRRETFTIELPQAQEKLKEYVGKSVIIGVRPENILTNREGDQLQPIDGVLKRYEHLGNKMLLYLDFMGIELCASAPVTVHAKVGQSLRLYLQKQKVHLFDAETKNRL